MRKLRILFCSSEITPFAKTGGLGDVVGALPLALKKKGIKVTCIMPLYSEKMRNKFDIRPVHKTFNLQLWATPETFSIYKTQLKGIDFFFLRCDYLFYRKGYYTENGKDYIDNARRFALFSAACIKAAEILQLDPDIFHVHDWQTALIPVYLHADKNTKARSLLTIHNLAYQGLFPVENFHCTGLDWDYFHWQRLEFYDKVNYLKGGIIFADAVSTVSPTYSKEIMQPEFGCGLEGVLKNKKDHLYGILNGIDDSVWNPQTDTFIPANYSIKDLRGKAVCRKKLFEKSGIRSTSKPLFGIVTRLAEQKGLDLLIPAIRTFLKQKYPFVILGTGDPEYVKQLSDLKKEFPDTIAVFLKFDNKLAHFIEAGSDIFLMPSRFEPCGLNQLYSMKYGTVPVVRATGGLNDSVSPVMPGKTPNLENTGFTFYTYDPEVLKKTIKEAINAFEEKETWNRLMRNGMKQNFNWDQSAQKYIQLYEKLTIKESTKEKLEEYALQE